MLKKSKNKNKHKTKQKQNINGIANDNNIINNPKDIAEHLNKHFCNIAKTIETEIPPSKQTCQDYLKNQQELL